MIEKVCGECGKVVELEEDPGYEIICDECGEEIRNEMS